MALTWNKLDLGLWWCGESEFVGLLYGGAGFEV